VDTPVSIAPSPESGAIRVTGTVKWFNPQTGYGFIVSEEVKGDILLHKSVVEAAGYGNATVLEGTTIECDVVHKLKGLQAKKVHRLDERTANGTTSSGTKEGNGAARQRREIVLPEAKGPAIECFVKFFSRPKGYGFFVPVVGGDDVFVHMDVLRHCGIRELRQGQRALVRVVESDKGLSATDVNMLPEVMAAPRPIRMMAPAEFEARP
jgi:cold shock protein